MSRDLDHLRRYDAYCALLALPEPIDLPARGRHYTYGGDATRRDGLKRDLERAYLRYRMQDAGEEAVIVSLRRTKLRLVTKVA